MYNILLTIIVAVNILASALLLIRVERVHDRMSLHFRKHRRPPPRKGRLVCDKPRPNRRVLS